MTLSSLISRLEAATEGSRGLDYTIRWVIAGYTDKDVSDERAAEADAEPNLDHAPHFSTSIDAALQLVPEGWFWRVGRTTIFQAWAGVNETHPDHGDSGRNEFFFKRELWEPKSTPALALCICALKARAALTNKENKDG